MVKKADSTVSSRSDGTDNSFDVFKSRLLSIDPVSFVEQYLRLEGKPFRIHGNGYKPFADIYRYVGIKALEPGAKPVLICKGRQVGMSIAAAALEMYFMGSGLFGGSDKPPIRIIHAFPQSALAEKFSKEKLGPMISFSAPINPDEAEKGKGSKSYMQSLLEMGDTNNSLHFKQFSNGNFLRIDSTGLTGDRLRGGSADVIFYDEVQDISGEAIGTTVEMLKQAKYGRSPGGVQIYFGTPKRKGSDFWKMWIMSSQQYYHLGCGKCKQLFPFYGPETTDKTYNEKFGWEKIWIHGFIVKCPHCGYEQNKNEAAERGKWVGTKDLNDPEVKFIGFHINQCYMPNITREDIEAERPNVHPTNTERKFQNEVLGEFYQGDASPITSEEIIAICGDRSRGMRARIKQGEEQLVLLGIDYGAKNAREQLANPDKAGQGQSYTTAVVMSVKGPNLFSIDLAVKFPKNDPEAKKGLIDTIMRQYSVNLAVADIGFSNDFSYTMHTIYGDKYLVSRSFGKIVDKVKMNEQAYPKEIQFEHDHYINEVYELMKKGQFKFPLKDYDRIAWLIDHCANMEMKASIPKYGGDPQIHYVKSGPNDGLMSIINAYLGYKYFISEGFKVKNPHLMNQTPGKKKGVPAIIARISKKL